jgi:hypothetical protein
LFVGCCVVVCRPIELTVVHWQRKRNDLLVD